MKVTILSVCLLAFLFTFSTQTFAADFGVNLTSDQHDANLADGFCDIFTNVAGAQCTLRAAVEQANALPSSDRIFFLFPNDSTVTLTTANGGEIQITDNGTLQIIGMGANNLTINGGTGTNRIFYTNEANVLITGVTLMGGEGMGEGFNGAGGAIFANLGSLTLERVNITGNAASNSAGGVYFVGGPHQITGSTVSANTGTFCAGINNNGTLTVFNSTISGNTAIQGGSGGGFCNSAIISTATLCNVTITNNTAFTGGGIYQIAGTLNFGNTIVAGNNAASGIGPEILFNNNSPITSAGGNLVGDSPGDSTNTGTFDIAYQPSDKQNVNPLLGPLQNNGGPTPTHELFVGSPAVDAGLNTLANSAGLTTDQRGTGFPRIRDGNGDGLAFVDIGAFEKQLAPTAASVSVSGRVTSTKGGGINNVRVTMTNSNGETRTALSNPFGYYSFADVPAGETYIFSVSSKRYNFNQSTQVLTIVDELTEVNFVADNKIVEQL